MSRACPLHIERDDTGMEVENPPILTHQCAKHACAYGELGRLRTPRERAEQRDERLRPGLSHFHSFIFSFLRGQILPVLGLNKTLPLI